MLGEEKNLLKINKGQNTQVEACLDGLNMFRCASLVINDLYFNAATVRKRANTRRFSTAQNNANTENDYKMKKGMVLPFTPLSLAFENIKYSIDMPQVV